MGPEGLPAPLFFASYQHHPRTTSFLPFPHHFMHCCSRLGKEKHGAAHWKTTLLMRLSPSYDLVMGNPNNPDAEKITRFEGVMAKRVQSNEPYSESTVEAQFWVALFLHLFLSISCCFCHFYFRHFTATRVIACNAHIQPIGSCNHLFSELWEESCPIATSFSLSERFIYPAVKEKARCWWCCGDHVLLTGFFTISIPPSILVIEITSPTSHHEPARRRSLYIQHFIYTRTADQDFPCPISFLGASQLLWLEAGIQSCMQPENFTVIKMVAKSVLCYPCRVCTCLIGTQTVIVLPIRTDPSFLFPFKFLMLLVRTNCIVQDPISGGRFNWLLLQDSLSGTIQRLLTWIACFARVY